MTGHSSSSWPITPQSWHIGFSASSGLCGFGMVTDLVCPTHSTRRRYGWPAGRQNRQRTAPRLQQGPMSTTVGHSAAGQRARPRFRAPSARAPCLQPRSRSARMVLSACQFSHVGVLGIASTRISSMDSHRAQLHSSSFDHVGMWPNFAHISLGKAKRARCHSARRQLTGASPEGRLGRPRVQAACASGRCAGSLRLPAR